MNLVTHQHGAEAACVMDDQKRFRFSLSRRFLEFGSEGTSWSRLALFVMLNPSTADALKDDATIRRLKGFTKTWGLAGFDVVNLFAWRSTNPKELLGEASPYLPRPAFTKFDPVAAEALQFTEDGVLSTAFARPYAVSVFAWGAAELPYARDREVIDLAMHTMSRKPWVFGYTKEGRPQHPLRLPKTQKLVPFPMNPFA